METMKLTTNWDLDLDGYGNLATVSENAAIAQNVATTCLVWRGEYYWDTDFGVPYKNILGEQPPLSSVSAYLSECAKTVDSVETVSVELKKDTENIRLLKGNILVNGEINVSI
jgi:hypothetical protein